MNEESKKTEKEIKTRNTDKKRIDQLESDVEEIKSMLHKMKRAIGLPDDALNKIRLRK